MMISEEFAIRLAKAVVDYRRIAKILQDTYEEARADPKETHKRSLWLAADRSKKKGRGVSEKQLSMALEVIKANSH
jgi:hypothetical protein